MSIETVHTTINTTPITGVRIVPYYSHKDIPPELVDSIFNLLNEIIIDGDTYPFENPLNRQEFLDYYCPNFIAVMVDSHNSLVGCFYIKPNYPGRSSHICNGGFLVSKRYRGLGIGKILGKQYVDWAPKLGYKSSVFNLVYETNLASRRIWEGLGFKVIGRIPQCGRLKGKDNLVDAIMYGKDFIEK